jgi:kinesin family protein 4/21/27
VLAYGQTGSGKTYSMGTAYDVAFSDDENILGVIPRAVKDLFEGVNERDDTEFCIKVSFLEIYNEDLNDLLNTSPRAEPLVVREDPSGSIKVTKLKKSTIFCTFPVTHIMDDFKVEAETNKNSH